MLGHEFKFDVLRGMLSFFPDGLRVCCLATPTFKPTLLFASFKASGKIGYRIGRFTSIRTLHSIQEANNNRCFVKLSLSLFFFDDSLIERSAIDPTRQLLYGERFERRRADIVNLFDFGSLISCIVKISETIGRFHMLQLLVTRCIFCLLP